MNTTFLLQLCTLSLAIAHGNVPAASFIPTEANLLNNLQVDNPNHAQKTVRMHARGDKDVCLALFKQAIDSNNPVARIHIANAYYAIGWGKDQEKDFAALTKEQLESYRFSEWAFDTVGQMYYKLNPDADYFQGEGLVEQTFTQAAQQHGNAFAQLACVLKHRWSDSHFGTACQLRPLLQRHSFPELLWHYGYGLLSSGLYNEQFELEGLSFMERSGLLHVKIANTNSADEFKSYCSRYIRHENVCSTYYKRYGMLLLSNGTIVAPTHDHWQQFKQNKLDTL